MCTHKNYKAIKHIPFMHDSHNVDKPEKPLKGYVVYPTYRIIEDEKDGKRIKKAVVYLFGKLENGESFLAMKDYVPYFYISKSDYEKKDS